MKGFLIAGTNSGIGKTTISAGLMSCFADVSPFKCGPDYIDGKYHEYVTKNKSYNLDYFLMGEEGIKYSFFKHHKGISIVEGVMGLYDGIDNSLDNGSSAHISRILNLPVILVVDGIGKSTSIAAQILGYKLFDERVKIKGVVINKVSSEKTYNIFKEAIEKYCGIKCFGYIKKNEELSISSRHLGLLQADEVEDLNKKIEIIKNEIKSSVDIEGIYNICDIDIKKKQNKNYDIFSSLKDRYRGLKIGIAKDMAFSFYYNDNIEFLENLGIEIKYFSPLSDKNIPDDVEMLYFGGGYPENFADELSNNISMKNSIKDFYENGGVIFAECGGFIYMCDELQKNGKSYKFNGFIDNIIEMKEKLDIKRFGYVNINYNGKNVGKGHEFHYSVIKKDEEDKKIFEISKKDGRSWKCGYSKKNLLAGYPHIHFFKSQKIIFEILDKTWKRR